ncbi:hypothetical protein CTAM01_11684 [Colletotrichum tamarilloi]|uniref:Uncharacterized protein n=1 Tax=Colletotrichum tamarilloi TaxID=1209934 RepID=A0ABQ9QWR7_9PEZI|nr:hypothetical protein CTAM01_11684 [Colletotrichum tamarilloi]
MLAWLRVRARPTARLWRATS